MSVKHKIFYQDSRGIQGIILLPTCLESLTFVDNERRGRCTVAAYGHQHRNIFSIPLDC
jgi:hypothetical protein